MNLCQRWDIPLHDYTLEDFELDVKTLYQLCPEIETNLRESGVRSLA